MRTKRKRKDSEDSASGETDSEHLKVDLFQLQVNTLRRYKKHYKVPVRQGLNKAQLADVSFCETDSFKSFCQKLGGSHNKILSPTSHMKK